jgi:hypothetical protein
MSLIEFARGVAPAAVRRWRLLPWFAVVGTAGLTACTIVGRPIAGADPSDPGAPVSAVRYQTTTAGYVSQRPIAPEPWRRQNESVTPAPKSEQ